MHHTLYTACCALHAARYTLHTACMFAIMGVNTRWQLNIALGTKESACCNVLSACGTAMAPHAMGVEDCTY